MAKMYKLYEIGYDTSIETKESLIRIANEHCDSYNDEREILLPINTIEKAINYFRQYGFEVEYYKEV